MKKLTIFTLCILVILTLLFTGCGKTEEPSSEAPAQQEQETAAPPAADEQVEVETDVSKLTTTKDSAIHVEKADLTTLNPLETSDRKPAFYQIYNTLLREDFNDVSKIGPCLAESWEINEANDEITFKLRQDVKFHNGDPLTADDVVFSLTKAIESPYNKAITSAMSEAIKVDDYTVKVTFKYPYAAMLGCFTCTDTSILSKSAFEADPEGFARNPVGTGPYRFVEWVPGEKVVLEAFPEYWEGQAPITNLTYLVIADATASVIALETGEVDAVFNPNYSDRQQLIDNPDITVYECAQNCYYALFFNNENELFKNKALRDAISYALDRESLVIGATEGVGSPVEAAMVPTCAQYPADFQANPYNIEKAKELLVEAGYPDGLTINMKTIDSSVYSIPSTIIQDQLRAIGITVNVELTERSKWMSDVVTNSDYEMTFYAVVAPVMDADFSCYSQFHSSGAFGNGNYANIQSEKMDELLEAARMSSDDAERNDLYRQVCELVRDESYIVPLYAATRTVAVPNALKGVIAHPAIKVFSHLWYWE